MSNLPEDTMPCTHCGASGRVPKRIAEAFPIGNKVWWRGGGYGHEGRVPADVVRHGKSGRTVRIRYTSRRRDGTPGNGVPVQRVAAELGDAQW